LQSFLGSIVKQEMLGGV